MESEYTKQAEKFLADSGLEFRAVLIGDDCPPYCDDAAKEIDMDKLNTYPRKTHIHGKHYRCTISRKERGHISFDFWNSYADEELCVLGAREYQLDEIIFKYDRRYRLTSAPKVQAYDLLDCITKDDPGSFEDFCGDFGYDTDSRKAEETYRAIVREWAKVRKFFSDSELAQLQEIQ